MLGGAARRPRATRLADLLLIRPHQVAATAPTPDRSETPAAGPQLKEGLTIEGPLQKSIFHLTGICSRFTG